MQIAPFCFFERSFYLIPRDEQDKSMFVKLVPHTHKQAIFKMPLVSVGTAQFFLLTEVHHHPKAVVEWLCLPLFLPVTHKEHHHEAACRTKQQRCILGECVHLGSGVVVDVRALRI